MSCIAKGCCNTKRHERELSFFCLPKNRELARKWLRILGRLDIAENEHKIYKICSEHFKESDYTKVYPRKLLSHEAMPSLNLQTSQSDYVNIIGRSDEEILLRYVTKPGRDVTSKDSITVYSRMSTNTSQPKTIQPNLKKNETKSKKIDLQHVDNRASIDISFINIDERLKQTQKNGIDYYKRYCKAEKTISRLRSKLKAQNRTSEKLILGDVNLENVLKPCRSLLSERIFSLFENELLVALNKGKHLHSYSKTMRRFCLELYKESPKAYSILSNTLNLPQKSTIKQWESCSKKWEIGSRDGRVTVKIENEHTDEQHDKYYEEVQYLDEDILGDDVLQTDVENCYS